MNDDEIHELADRKQNETYNRIENTVRTFTDSIFIETQGIKKSIDALTGNIKEQNGHMRKLKEWKDGIEGGKIALKERGDKSGKWITQIILGAGVLVAICFGAVNSCSSKEIEKQLYWKADRKPDSTTKSIKNYSITKDTAFIRKLEESTKKLLK